MATLTIRGVDESTRHNIQIRAAQRGHSMEAEVRETLSRVYDRVPFGQELLKVTEQFRKDTGGVDLEIPSRSVPRIIDLSDGLS